MAGAYDIQTYLLDRENIHDTVTRLTLYIDTKSADGLANEVYAPNIVIDYTSLFGGKANETTNQAWSKSVESMMEAYDSTQHIVTGILIQLPQPTNEAGRPDTCTVIANVTAHMVRQEARGGPMMHNGGRYVLDLIRLPDLEGKGENPWRISKHGCTLSWLDGNMDVMKPVEGIGH